MPPAPSFHRRTSSPAGLLDVIQLAGSIGQAFRPHAPGRRYQEDMVVALGAFQTGLCRERLDRILVKKDTCSLHERSGAIFNSCGISLDGFVLIRQAIKSSRDKEAHIAY